AVDGGFEHQGLELPAGGGAGVGLLVEAEHPAGGAVRQVGGDDGVPVAGGAVAVDLDQRVGDVVDDKGHHLEIPEQPADILAPGSVADTGATVPDAVFGEQFRHLVGKAVGGAVPAAVVVVHVGGLELDDGLPVLHHLEALFEGGQSAFEGVGHGVPFIVGLE